MNKYAIDDDAQAGLDAALAGCDSEPIRVPGAVQPHGVLLTLQGSPLCIGQISANCGPLLGKDVEQLLGQALTALLSPEQTEQVLLAANRLKRVEVDSLLLLIGGAHFNASLHRVQDVLIMELEPVVAPEKDQSRVIARVLRNLQAATTLEALFDISVNEIQALTGYDRVLIYRFEPEGHGKVVGEALTGSLPSYRDLNFPGSDIPSQARELYRLNWIRVIPDAAYVAVPLQPLFRPDNGEPLDLGFSVLRSVSPVHCEYLKNMGVRSSMSISLLDRGELWGLIACAHPQPLLVSREVRDACAFIGQLLSVQIGAIVAMQIQREREDKVDVLRHLTRAMNNASLEIFEGLISQPELLQSLTAADGAAVLVGDRLELFGQCPTPLQVRALHVWIRDIGQPGQALLHTSQGLQGLGIFHSHALDQDYPASSAYRDIASGVVAFILPKPVDNAVMWFRSQRTSTMDWSGNPTQHLSASPAGSASHRLHPRQSFDVWQQQVVGVAKPWSMADLYAAEDLRRSALENDLERQVHRAQEAVRLRDELVAVVSHDLRNPMSIIIMQCGMMQKWAVSENEQGSGRISRALGTVEMATTRMNRLLEDLLDTARIEAGRYQLVRHPLDVGHLLEEACALLVSLTAHKHIELNCTSAAGLMIDADPERIFQVLSNLLGNAVKFTPIGGRIDMDAVRDGDAVVFTVRDNGIGISAEHLPFIFQRYWSAKEGNPSGNGLGLFISRGIIDAHGGTLWAESERGAGSVFIFKLPLLEVA